MAHGPLEALQRPHGCWLPGGLCSSPELPAPPAATPLQPRVPLPSAIVSYVVRAGLPANIQAVARRAEMIAANRLKVSGLARWAGTEDDPPIPPSPGSAQRQQPRSASEQEAAEEAAARAVATALEEASSQLGQQPGQQQQQQQQRDEGLPSKGPFWRLNSSSFPEAAPLTAARQLEQQGISAEQLAQQADQAAGVAGTPGQFRLPSTAQPQSSYLGVVSIPLPPAGNRGAAAPQTQQELNQRQEQKERQQASYPAFRVGRLNGRSSGGTAVAAPPGTSKQAAAAAEVHLRRLDTFDTLHRRAVAAVTIDAPPEVRWGSALGACCTHVCLEFASSSASIGSLVERFGSKLAPLLPLALARRPCGRCSPTTAGWRSSSPTWRSASALRCRQTRRQTSSACGRWAPALWPAGMQCKQWQPEQQQLDTAH